MNITDLNEIYLALLKRKPTNGDIKAHINKNKEMFKIEVKKSVEYNTLITNSLVSIIIPTRNRNHTLMRAVNSCIDQTYKNLEIIICDDSDSDYTITQKYYNDNYKSYHHIKYIRNKKNLGFCKNINQGLKVALGKYVTMLFDDDYYYEGYIDASMNIFKQNNDIGFITTAAHNLLKGDKKNNNTFHLLYQKYSGKLHKYYYYNGLVNLYRDPSYIVWSVSPCNYIFRNNKVLLREKLYPKFDEKQLKCGAGYDLLFILDNLKLCEYFYVNTEHLLCFDSTQGSFTVDNTKYVIDRMDVTVKYWLCYELVEPNVLLKLKILDDYNNTVKDNVVPHEVLGKIDLPNTNKMYVDHILKTSKLL